MVSVEDLWDILEISAVDAENARRLRSKDVANNH